MESSERNSLFSRVARGEASEAEAAEAARMRARDPSLEREYRELEQVYRLTSELADRHVDAPLGAANRIMHSLDEPAHESHPAWTRLLWTAGSAAIGVF